MGTPSSGHLKPQPSTATETKALMDLAFQEQQILMGANKPQAIVDALEAYLKTVADAANLPRDAGLTALEKLTRQNTGAQPLQAVQRVELALLQHRAALQCSGILAVVASKAP